VLFLIYNVATIHIDPYAGPTNPPEIEPEETYYGSFKDSDPPLQLRSDTAGSFNYLAQGSADLSITYHAAAEAIAIEQGFVERSVYAWRDHFMLVGPQ